MSRAETPAGARGGVAAGIRGLAGMGGATPCDWALGAVLTIASLALYLRTVAPGLLEGDEGEFQVNIFKLGVSHTGYPFFFLLGKLWTMLLPVGTVATRANLFSAAWGAVAVAATFAAIWFLTRNRWAASVAALLFAASRVEWSQAVIPRVYTMNSFFVVVVTLLFFLWRMGKVDLTVPIFAFGLSLTNHRTMMWFAPAIAVFVLWHERAALFRPRRLFTLAVAFVLPLLLYGYVFWRGESDVGVEFHWKDFNDEIMGGYVRASWRFGPLDWLVSRVTELYLPMLIEQFTPLGFVAGLVGAAALALDRPPRGWPRTLPAREAFVFLVLANLANTAFCVIFWVIDIDKFFLPSFITFLFFSGVGVAVVWDGFTRGAVQWPARAVVVAACVAAVGWLLVRNLPLNDWSARTEVAQAWEENLAQPLEANAVIAGSWESITPLEYAMYVDGRRRDLERWKLIINNYQLGQVPYGSRQEDIEQAVRAGRPVYLTIYPGETETLAALVQEFRLTRVGDLWRVVDQTPANAATLESFKAATAIATFADSSGRALELLGSTWAAEPRAGEFSLATLYWRVPAAVSARWTVSLRVLDSAGRTILQRDAEPASGRLPTNGWLTNEVIADDIGLLIPPDAPPGQYRLQLAVYNASTGEGLKAGDAGVFTLKAFDLAPAASTPSLEVLAIQNRVDQPVGGLSLIGYDWGTLNPRGGDALDLSLWWRSDSDAQDERISLTLRGEGARSVPLYAGSPIADYPTGAWGRGRVLRGRYTVSLPLDWAGPTRLVVESNGRTVGMPPLQVAASGRTLTVPPIGHPFQGRLGDSMQLLGYDMDRSQVRPGESIRLTLYWQALQPPPASYVVFAHALDPDGVLRGQKDAVPRDGALPTDHWTAGEVVADSYVIPIVGDAPPGEYQFEVGMYLAETGARVPVSIDGIRAPQDRLLLRDRFKVAR